VKNKTPFGPFGAKPPEVPLPNDLPKKMDISNLPDSILRSRTFESMSQQNEDLHARLNISLKRIAKLEDHLSGANENNERLRYQYDTLNDQVLILKEKTMALVERRGLSSTNLNKLKEELKLARMRYTELNETSEKREKQFNATHDNLLKKAKLFLKHKNKMTEVAHNLKDDLTASQKKINDLNTRTAELKNKIAENTDDIQKQEQVFTQNHKDEIDKLKQQVYQLETDLKKKNHSLGVDAQNNKKMIEDFKNQSLELQTIMSKRSAEDEKIIDSLRKELKIADDDVKAAVAREQILLEQSKTLKQSLSDIEANFSTESRKLNLTKEANEGLRLQLKESLSAKQNLSTADSENKLLRSELYMKVESLQKLNKQLSTQLNLSRAENKKIKSRMMDLENYKNQHQGLSLTNFKDQKEYSNEIDSLIADIKIGKNSEL